MIHPNWRQRYFRSEVWLHALQTLSILLRNTCLGVALVWISTLCFSRGNVFSGRAPAQQSDFEFLLGTCVTTHTFFYGIFIAAHTPVLMPLEFAALVKKRRRTTFLFCVQRLARHTFVVYFWSLTFLVSVLMLLHAAPKAFRKRHVEFYVSNICIHCYNVSLGIALRSIFRGETLLGHGRSRPSSSVTRKKRFTWWHSVRYYWRTWVRMLPLALAVMLAGLYVQLTSRYRVTGGWDFLWYTLGSLVFKVMIKEAAKVGIVRFNIQDPRTIFIVVGLPTVLVDTQVRIMLQRVQSLQYALVWTFGMAVLEISTRLSKVLWMKRKLERRDSKTSMAFLHVAVAASQGRHNEDCQTTNGAAATAVMKRFGSLRDETRTIQWRIQMMAFQIAESYANMSAEYLAIGCSTCILYFYWDHPKYDLGEYTSSSSAGSGTSSSQHSVWFQGSTLALQIGVEIAVDYISCVLEIGEGIDFQEVRRYRVFLALLFMCIASVNIHICVLIYMSDG